MHKENAEMAVKNAIDVIEWAVKGDFTRKFSDESMFYEL